MSGIRAALPVFLASILSCVFNGPPSPDGPRPDGPRPDGPGLVLPRALEYDKNVKPEDLRLESCSITRSIKEFARDKRSFKEFRDPEDVVSKGPITKIEVYSGSLNPVRRGKGEFIHGIRLYYGWDRKHGVCHGYTHGIEPKEWIVPKGERITLVKGEYSYNLCRLQFFTDRGSKSPVYGGTFRGRRFEVEDKSGGELRTISGWVDSKTVRVKRPARKRFLFFTWRSGTISLTYYPAIRSMTFHFNAPYFIKKIEYDPAALEACRREAIPQIVYVQQYNNDTSVQLRPRKPFEYEHKVIRTRTLTFRNSFGLKFGEKTGGEVSALLKGIGGKMSKELSWEKTVSTESSESVTDTIEETVTWSCPIVAPPRRTVICRAVWSKAKIRIPFVYTVAWYLGTRDNIKKEVRLPGMYEYTDFFDLKVDIKELPLEKALP